MPESKGRKKGREEIATLSMTLRRSLAGGDEADTNDRKGREQKES